MLIALFILWSIVSLSVLVYAMVFRNTSQSEYDRLIVVQGNILRDR